MKRTGILAGVALAEVFALPASAQIGGGIGGGLTGGLGGASGGVNGAIDATTATGAVDHTKQRAEEKAT